MNRPPNTIEFFRRWTPNMAYILGYWWADGCMRIKSNTGAHNIDIASNDLDHLETMAQTIGGNYHLRKVAQNANTYVISFCSKEMYQDILAHGGTPRKSCTIGFPFIPDELLPHFVRGVVDGDGSLCWNGDRPIIHIYSGSEHFLVDMCIAITKLTGIPSPNIAMSRTTKYVKWSTIRAKCLAAWLYFDNPGLALARKSAIAARFLEWQPKRKPDPETITDAMRLNFPDYLPS